MDRQSFYVEQKTPKTIPVRVCFSNAAEQTTRDGNLFSLVIVTLFCIAAGFTAYFMPSIVAELLHALTPMPLHVIDWAWLALVVLGALLLVLPLLMGRIRMTGLIAMGDVPPMGEVFYYFTRGERYLRGLGISVLFVLSVGIPAGLGAGSFYGVWAMYTYLFLPTLAKGAAVLLVIPCYMLAALLCVGYVFLSGLWFPCVALAVGNEELSVLRAVGMGLRVGCRRLVPSFCFCCRAAWHLLLSALTVGVLWLLYYGQRTPVAYMTYVQNLTNEGCP